MTERRGELTETWDGDGAGGVMFKLPSGGIVFVARWLDRGQPDKATEEDWADAELLLKAFNAYRQPLTPCGYPPTDEELKKINAEMTKRHRDMVGK